MPAAGTVGTIVTIRGTGYGANDNITISFGINTNIQQAVASMYGSFTAVWTVDTQVYGTTTITASGISSATNMFHILLEVISVQPTAGSVGMVVTVAGTGYAANDNITIAFGTNANIQQTVASSYGTFSTTWTVDTQQYGTTTVTASGVNVAVSIFRILPEVVSVSPTDGTVGTIVTVSGTGYGGSDNITIAFGINPTIQQVVASQYGTFSTTWTVDTQHYGTTTITASGVSVATNVFHILPQVYSVIPTAGTVGTIVTICGTGYGSNDNITIAFGINPAIQQTVTSTNGSFTTIWTVDTQTYGTTTIIVTGANSSGDENTFFINHVIAYMTPTKATVGSIIKMMGTGYGASQEVQVAFGITNPIATITTDNRGLFEITWTVDSQIIGSKTVTVSVDTLTDTVSLKILSAIILVPDYGSAGEAVSVIGTGFGSNENIRVDFGERYGMVFGKASENGTFNIQFILVSQQISRVKITATGLTTNAMVEAYLRLMVVNISPEVGYGLPGDLITISGRGFAFGEFIDANTIMIGSRTVAHGVITIAQDGTFGSMTITVPNLPVGMHDITILIGQAKYNFLGMYEVKPSINLGEYMAGPPSAGYKISFNATGFPSNGIIKGMELDQYDNILMVHEVSNNMGTYNTLYKTTRISVDGTVTIEMTLPAMPLGSKTLRISVDTEGGGKWLYDFKNVYFVSNAPVLFEESLSPESAAAGTQFMFRCRYQEKDGEVPQNGYPRVVIYKNGDVWATVPMEMWGNIPHYTGSYWVAKQTMSESGYYEYRYEARDIHGVPATGIATSLHRGPWVGVYPTLSWVGTGSMGYETDGVSPDTGSPETLFTFKVKYTHVFAPASGYPRVILYKDGIEAGSLILSGSGTGYSSGVVFSTTTTLPNMGSYSYRFDVIDIKGIPACGEPIKERIGPMVSTIPTLSWLETAGYESDGVSPDDGTKDTVFTFKVKYTGMIPPAANSPRVIITSTGGEVIEGKMFGTGTSYADGVEFSYATKLSGKGIYSYSFRGEDANGMIATGTPIQIMSGPKVNISPVLSWAGGIDYGTSGVSPLIGAVGDKFIYKVKYTDDSDAPAYIRVVIKAADGSSMLYDLVLESGTATSGVYSTTINLTTSGTYSYRFEAQDGKGADAIGTPTGIFAGPTVVTTGCSLSSGGVDLNTGTANTTVFTYSVIYTDSKNQALKIGYPKIHILLGEKEVKGGLMSPVDFMDTTYTDGKAYQYKGSLPYSGQYSFWFEAFNKNNEPARTDVFQGPTVGGVNVAPNLSWTGEVGYENDGVNPDGVGSGKECVYKVKYTDVNNDSIADGYPKVSIYNPFGQLISSVVMEYESGSWSTGAIYRLATSTFPVSGRYSYKFEAKDAVGATAIGSPVATNNGPTVSGAPELSWIGSTVYEKDGIDPEFGSAKNTVFIYQVRYTDPDGDKPYPGYPKLHIYKGGVELAGESPKSMIKVTVGETDAVYKSGVVYKVANTFKIGGSEYTYRFEATDRWGVPAIGEPMSRMMDAPDISTPPVLKWTKMSNGYIRDGVDPDSGQCGASFTFTVKYSDYDNDAPAPGYPQVAIFAGDTLFDSFTMAHVDPVDNNYKDGKLYTYSVKLPITGVYSYQFVACDINNIPAQGVAVVKQKGPVVSSAPAIEWLGTEYMGYEYDGLEPHEGKFGTNFVFKVRYMDIDGDAPDTDSPRVHLFVGGEDVTPKKAGYIMKPLTSVNKDYKKGVIYSYSVKLMNNGEYSYEFRGEDKYGVSAGGAASTRMPGPIVSGRNVGPTLSWPVGKKAGVVPVIGEPEFPFVFEVVYKDINNDAPGEYYPVVKILKNRVTTEYPMIAVGTGTNAEGMLYRAEIRLSSGVYYHSFAAKDSYGLLATGIPRSIKKGPYVAYAPSLSEGEHTPSIGQVSRTRFTFKVKYTDTGKFVPYPGYPKIHILCGGKDIPNSPFVMTANNRNKPEIGKQYKCIRSLPYVSDAYTYYFEAKNYLGVPSMPTTEYQGPSVSGSKNWPPKINWVGSVGYLTDGVNPDVGTPLTNLVFSIRYEDPESQAPKDGYPKVYIYKDTNIPVGTYQMVNVGTSSYAQGAVFATTDTINLPVGAYGYKFEAYDNGNLLATGIPTKLKNGLIVTNAPVLSWAADTGYGTDGVNPESGVVKKTTFKYLVRYQDEDNNPPAAGYPKLYITKSDGTPITGSPFAMQFVAGSGQPYNGLYEYKGVIFRESGEYKYQIEAYDKNMMRAEGDASGVEMVNPVISSEWASQIERMITIDRVVDTYNYPNPTYNGITTFRCEFDNEGTLTAGSVKVSVDVYDVAGDPVWSDSVDSKSVPVEVPWYGRNEADREVANGVYIYRMIVEYNDKREVKIGKIAVIR